MNKILTFILPWIENKQINKTLKNQMSTMSDINTTFDQYKDEEDIYIENKEAILEEYNRTIDIKDKLEDKAKANIVAFTVSISLILGLSALISSIYGDIDYKYVHYIIFTITIVGMVFMIIASLLSINMLNNENIVYMPNLLEFNKSEIELYKIYMKSVDLNKKQNLIRNNMIFTSYECIRNSIFCFFIVFIISILPYREPNYIKINYEYDNTKIAYSVQAIGINDSNVIPMKKEINEFISLNINIFKENKEYTLIDRENNLLIKAYWNGEWIIVNDYEKIDN